MENSTQLHIQDEMKEFVARFKKSSLVAMTMYKSNIEKIVIVRNGYNFSIEMVIADHDSKNIDFQYKPQKRTQKKLI